MSLYTLQQLLQECSMKFSRTRTAADKKRETLDAVWKAFSDWIEDRFHRGKGVHISTFASISWELNTTSKNVPNLRPAFVLSETFVKTYGLKSTASRTPNVNNLAALEDINFTKIAIKYSRTLTKDLVFCGIRDLLQRLGEVAATGSMMSISLGIGKIIAKNRVMSMEFNSTKLPRSVRVETAQSTVGCPPLELGDLANINLSNEDDWKNKYVSPLKKGIPINMSSEDQVQLPTLHNDQRLIQVESPFKQTESSLEDELCQYDSSLRTPRGQQKKDMVLELAMRRYISQAASNVEMDATYVYQEQFQQKQDLERIAKEKSNRRRQARNLQQHLREQMSEKSDGKREEQAAQKAMSPTVNSFYVDGEMEMKGFEDRSYKTRVKQKLKTQLEDQIVHRQQHRSEVEQRNLEEDKAFLRELESEMQRVTREERERRERVRQSLTESWARDSGIKKLVEVKRRQKIQELVAGDGLGASPRRRIYTSPEVGTDYSVGFDPRSVT